MSASPVGLGALAAAAGELLVALDGDPATPISGLSYDLRQVAPGHLFFLVDRGERGRRYARMAVDRGAIAICTAERTDAPAIEILVSDARRAMARISAAFHGHPGRDLALVAVTGTQGKTTTSFLIEAILAAAGRRVGVIGSVEARIAGRATPSPGTTPDPPDLHALLRAMRDERVDTAVLEVTSHALVYRRVEGLRFEVAAFTNLAPDHLEFHASVEDYFAAKRSLFMPELAARAAVNVDDPYGRVIAETATIPCVGFGVGRAAQVRAEAVELGAQGSRFRLVTPSGRADADTGLIGMHNVLNCLAAAATAHELGVAPDAIVRGLAAIDAVPGRLERIDMGQPFAVLVDFARLPESLEAAIGGARLLAQPAGRVIVVFGCRGDLDAVRRPRMGAVAARLADRVIVTLDNPAHEDPLRITQEIVAGMPEGGASHAVVLERDKAIDVAIGQAKAGDVVLIEGGGVEHVQNILGREFTFDDRRAIAESLRRRGWDAA